MTEFNEFSIKAKTVDGGVIIRADLMLDGVSVDSLEKIVAGKPGTQITGSRVRKAVRGLTEMAYPKMVRVAVDAAGQLTLPGTV